MIKEFFCKLDAGDSDLDIKVLGITETGTVEFYCSKQGANLFFSMTVNGHTVPVKPEKGGVTEVIGRFMINYPSPTDMVALTYLLQEQFCPLANNRVMPG